MGMQQNVQHIQAFGFDIAVLSAGGHHKQVATPDRDLLLPDKMNATAVRN